MTPEICFIFGANHKITDYSDLIRGWEIILYDYSQYLIKRGFRVFWVAYSASGLEFKRILDGIRIVNIKKRFAPWNPIEFMRMLFMLTSIIRKHNVKVTYTRNSHLGLIAGLSCKITRTSFIFHIEDLEQDLILSHGKSFGSYVSALYISFAQKKAAMMADKVLTVSNVFRQFLIDSWLIPKGKTSVLYEGVEKSTLPQKPFFSSHEKHLFTVLYVGGTSPFDGVDVLIKAFAKVAEKVEKVKLTIAVFSPQHKCTRFAELCNVLGISHMVEFISSISGQDARNLVRDADIGVITRKRTHNTELTTSSVIFLYFSEGIPVIVPRLKAISELISEEASFFEPGNSTSLANALIRLISDNKLREKISRYSLKMRVGFRREKMCKKLVNLIESLLKR